ncbi:MAG: MFS transporter [Sphingomonas sp.]
MTPGYWGEVRQHWRPLFAATLGLGVGIGLNAYTAALFAPRLIAEFGWTRSQIALLGSFALLMLVMQPITGRLADRYGVRTVATVGVLIGPLAYVALAMQTGRIGVFFAITILQIVFGTLTTSPVYTRIVAERFERSRGLAFSIVMTGPPLAGAIGVPLLDMVIGGFGWRAGYATLGAVSLVLGVTAVLLTPRGRPLATPEPTLLETVALDPAVPTVAMPDPPAPGDASLRAVLRNPVFWVLIVGMVLVNIPQGLFSHQLKLVLMDSGAPARLATWLISVFAVGVIGGRFACGLSLDRLSPHHVAAFALGTPAIGMLLLASPLDAPLVLTLAVAVMGLAQGAEGDIAAYLVSRRFSLSVFSMVMGLVGASIAGGAAIGSLLLSVTLDRFDDYTPFLIGSAVSTLLGALLFLRLGRQERAKGIAA